MRARHLLVLLALPAIALLYVLVRSPTHATPPEIFGLLHFVTSPDEADRVVTTLDLPPSVGGPITPEEPVEMAWYALGSTTGWDERLSALPPLVVFSKSYCPFSKRAKRLLEAYDLLPAPKIIEVDLRPDAAHIKTLLIRLTNHSTFPNVILHGLSLGGSDDLVRLHEEDKLREILEEGGMTVRQDIILF